MAVLHVAIIYSSYSWLNQSSDVASSTSALKGNRWCNVLISGLKLRYNDNDLARKLQQSQGRADHLDVLSGEFVSLKPVAYMGE